MGRPKLETDKKLSEWFIFRLTKDELVHQNLHAGDYFEEVVTEPDSKRPFPKSRNFRS